MAGKDKEKENYLDIDDKVDWIQFFANYGVLGRLVGSNVRARCPFHHDREPSFSFNVHNGKWQCFGGCGHGNGISFIAKIEGISNSDAWRKLCSIAGVDPTASKAKEKRILPETLQTFSENKRLPVEWLRGYGLSDGIGANGVPCVMFPMLDENGQLIRTKRRYGAGGSRRFDWAEDIGVSSALYGLWLDLNKNADEIIIVEGESDSLTLWYHNIPCIGVSGCSGFKKAWTSKPKLLNARKIIIHNELDTPEVFSEGVAAILREGGFTGEITEIACSLVFPGLKDPSSLHVVSGDDWPSDWAAVMATEKPVSVTDKLIEGAKPAKQIAPLETFSAADIVASDAEPPRQIVLGVLTEGLSILCGKPKLGKSWLGLSLALCVSAGVPFLGHSVDGGSCLYFDLEGSKARLKSRISAIWNGDVPRGLQVAFRTSETLAGGGILEQIAKWADSVENPKLVVIDTLGRAKGFAGNRSANAYEVDTTIYSPLAQFALDRHIAVLGVHHLRKMATVDGLDAVSGSLGLPGVCDCFWLLSRPRLGDDSENGTLQIGGRDLQDAEMLLRWQKPGWALLAEDGAAYTAKQRYATSEIVTAIKAFARDWHTGDYWEGRVSDFLVECAKLKIPCSATAVEFSKGLREFASKLYAETGLLVRFVRFKKGNGFSLERPIADGF